MKPTYFEMGGEEHTEKALLIAKEAAIEKKIPYILVASTTGSVALKAAEIFKDTKIKIIAITHNTGFKDPGVQEMPESIRKKLKLKGVEVYTGTMVLRGIGAAVREIQGGSEENIIANTLRLFGQGIKVCVEMAAMAADAGLIPVGDVIAVAGTRKGADTVAVVSAQPSNRFFNIKVREILAKPKNW